MSVGSLKPYSKPLKRFLKIGALFLLGSGIPLAFKTVGTSLDVHFDIPLILELLVGGILIILFALIIPGMLNSRGHKEIEILRRENVIPGARILLEDTRPYFLYLRAFGTDNTRPEKSLLYRYTLGVSLPEEGTYEETIVNTIKRQFGPVVAVGEPGAEVLPPLGAGRFWFEDDVWQGEVRAMMSRAKAILFVLGEAIPPGLGWELEQAFSRGDTPLLFVLSPSLKGRTTRMKALWSALERCTDSAHRTSSLTDAAVTVVCGDAAPVQYLERRIRWPFEPLERPISQALNDIGNT